MIAWDVVNLSREIRNPRNMLQVPVEWGIIYALYPDTDSTWNFEIGHWVSMQAHGPFKEDDRIHWHGILSPPYTSSGPTQSHFGEQRGCPKFLTFSHIQRKSEVRDVECWPLKSPYCNSSETSVVRIICVDFDDYHQGTNNIDISHTHTHTTGSTTTTATATTTTQRHHRHHRQRRRRGMGSETTAETSMLFFSLSLV